LERIKERLGGGELIDAFGEKGVEHPGAFMRRAAVADPGEAAHQGAKIQHRDALAELLVQLAQGAEFLREHWEKLSLQVLPEVGKRVRHTDPIKTDQKCSNKSQPF